MYGPSGAGKKTRIVATLKELYGPGVEKIKIDARVFQTSSNRKLEFNIVASVYHLEITPSDVGNYDRVVVQDLLKEVHGANPAHRTLMAKFSKDQAKKLKDMTFEVDKLTARRLPYERLDQLVTELLLGVL